MSSIQAIVMPKWGLAMKEGTLTSWLVPEGTEVTKGDEIAEIETTKIANVFESPISGKLRKLVLQSGEIAPVGALLAVIADDATPPGDIESFVNGFVVEATDDSGASDIVDSETMLDGQKISYRLAGKNAPGHPIVLIHGFGGDMDNWALNQQALSVEHPVYAIDLPGHGKSTKTVRHGDLFELADAVVAVMDHAGVSKAHMVGHSLGAAVAAAILVRHGSRVTSITGLAPAGIGDTVNNDYIAGFINAEKRKDVKAALQMLVANPEKVSASMIEGIQRFKRLENVREALSLIASKILPDGRQSASFRQLLESNQVPVQIIWGDADIIIPASQSVGLAPSISVTRLANVGHMPHLEASDLVNAKILEFTRT